MIKSMKNDHQKGSILEGVLMLMALSVIIFVFVLPTGQLGPTKDISSFGSGSGSQITPSSQIQESEDGAKDSVYSRSIFIRSGNASYSFQPHEEYISIENDGDAPVDITGWQVKNAKNERTYSVGGSLQRFPSDQVMIPRASPFVSPTGNNVLENVVLKRNERAIITTGSMGARSPYQIVSFKENKCSGYLESLSEYSFTPALSLSCVRPANEPGANSLDVPCQKYLESMQSCRTPKFDTVDRDGNVCHGCVDGNSTLGSACVAFIKTHFSYAGCIANHQSDPDFSSNRWRIFLNRPWELWAESRESISLFDTSGKLVDHLSY